MPLQLDWMNLFGGLTSGQVVSVVVVAIIFTAAAGLTILGLIAFGVRSGLMAPGYTSRVPSASDVELGAFLLAAAFGMIAVLLMVFLGLAENDLDNPIFLPFSVGPILIGDLITASRFRVFERLLKADQREGHHVVAVWAVSRDRTAVAAE
ncbi:MAG: hypothetical protein E6I88_11270 [Chloroflexi bacterium]|nr:MAG: hypothetical protein E6I88_11270 [Chloroflexota bacterium]